MYLAVDIGGTKTLLACFDNNGSLVKQIRFLTPPNYGDFLKEFKNTLPNLQQNIFDLAAVAAPGRVDRNTGKVLGFGRLKWGEVSLGDDIKQIINCPMLVENDANLAGLSEAQLLPQYKKILYVTISTGIGDGVITDGKIDPSFADSEPGQMLIEHDGKYMKWEDFASGKAIVQIYGKEARNITDENIWHSITKNISTGLLNLLAIIQPDIVVLGGGVGNHYDKYSTFLKEELKKGESPLLPIPKIVEAKRPEEAVIYGCYELIRTQNA